MTSGQLDASVEEFITSCINSVEQLEILLLLRSRQAMDAEAITSELRTTLSSVVKRLEDLHRKCLVSSREQDGRTMYFYEPSPRITATIDLLATLYLTHRVAIINAIFSKPSSMLTDFSDAFRLRDKEKGK